MAKIEDSFKKLSVENGAQKHNDNLPYKGRNELILSIEEPINHNYILAVCGIQSDPEFRICTALSDRSCVVYSVGERISHTISLTHNRATIVGIKFSPTSKNILYSATNKGLISVCDLRAKGKVVSEFQDSTEGGKIKPLASFDISPNDRLMAGGTEHIGGDAFILFWDIRHNNSKLQSKNTLLGGYWESHLEDVTGLAFHPNKQDILASGSTDGLMNVFDLSQPSEDSALTYSLNTESSVDRIGWLNDNSLWCTTHTHSLQLWDCEGATPYAKFERNNLAIPQTDDPDNCYIVKFHASNAIGEPFLLSGSTGVKGDKLRCWNIVNNRLERRYEMVGNRQLVRDSWLHEKSGSLITVGEGGLISIWRQEETSSAQQSNGHKLVAKIGKDRIRDRQHRTKPY